MMDIIPPQKNINKKRTSSRKKWRFLRLFITLITIFNLVVYQSFIPLAIVRAEDSKPIIEEETVEEEAEETEEDTGEVEDEETGEKENEEGEAEDECSGDYGCLDCSDESEEEESGEEDESSDNSPEEVLEISDTSIEEEEGGTEAVEEIKNENDAVMENTVEVIADTGNNQIGEDPESGEENQEENNTEECLFPDECQAEEDSCERPKETDYPEDAEECPNICECPCADEEQEDQEENNDCVCPCENTEVITDECPDCSDETVEKDESSDNSPEEVLETLAVSAEEEEEEETGSEEENAVIEETPVETLEEEEVVIETGEAAGAANIFNEVNSNITGENWVELVYNLYGDYVDDINLLEQFLMLLEEAVEESGEESLSVENKNDAEVKNDIKVDVNTGNNEINTEGEEASIATGDANASVNLVNFINQNITGNNWMFSVINVFGNWFGDLIVPGEDLLEMESSSDSGYSNKEITNGNEAEIKNNVEVTVNTGSNEINDGENEASIETGDAISNVGVYNLVNKNTTGDNWFFLLVNNMGSWVGNIFNWNEENEVYNYMFGYDFGTDGIPDGMLDGINLNVLNQNSADVENNVTVNVNTGGNVINDSGEASITTGNASAWVKIANFINNNIVGNNWLFAVVNIMGHWQGDLVFAYPDLSVFIGDGKETVAPGETLNYTVAYKNWGEAEAESVELMVSLPEQVSYQSDNSGFPLVIDGNDYVWTLPDMPAGEEGYFILNVVVKQQAVSGTVLEAVSGIKTSTTEKYLENNFSSDQTEVLVPERKSAFPLESVNISSSSEGEGINQLASVEFNEQEEQNEEPRLELSRESNINGPIQSGFIMQHRIILENTGLVDIYDAKVKEKIKNERGEFIVEYAWEVGDIEAGEIVLVDYEVLINGQVTPGIYQLEASAYGYDEDDEKIKSNKASMEMKVIAVLGNYLSENSGDIIPAAQAAGLDEPADGNVLGVENRHSALPLWIWLLAALSYLLSVNWSLFPKKRKTRLS